MAMAEIHILCLLTNQQQLGRGSVCSSSAAVELWVWVELLFAWFLLACDAAYTFFFYFHTFSLHFVFLLFLFFFFYHFYFYFFKKTFYAKRVFQGGKKDNIGGGGRAEWESYRVLQSSSYIILVLRHVSLKIHDKAPCIKYHTGKCH